MRTHTCVHLFQPNWLYVFILNLVKWEGCACRKPSFSSLTSPLPMPSQALCPAEGETQRLLLENELYVDLMDVGSVSLYKQREKFSSKCIKHSCCLTDTGLLKCCNLDFRIQGTALHVGEKENALENHWGQTKAIWQRCDTLFLHTWLSKPLTRTGVHGLAAHVTAFTYHPVPEPWPPRMVAASIDKGNTTANGVWGFLLQGWNEIRIQGSQVQGSH